jgi:hypothetical protein
MEVPEKLKELPEGTILELVEYLKKILNQPARLWYTRVLRGTSYPLLRPFTCIQILTTSISYRQGRRRRTISYVVAWWRQQSTLLDLRKRRAMQLVMTMLTPAPTCATKARKLHTRR